MEIEGIEVSAGAAAHLALTLHRNGDERLSRRIGFAVDHLEDRLWLEPRERTSILWVLMDCPDGLGELRAALISGHIGTRELDGYRAAVAAPRDLS